MTTPHGTDAAPDSTGPGSGPIPIAWFSWAAAATGLAALAANAISLVSHWSEDSQAPSSVDGIDRVTAALATLSGATVALLIVGVVADRGSSRRWALIGAAAYALSYVFRAALEQRSFSLLG
ncbi:MAG: hypothetical protein KDC46_03585 [Thermoleophilia bacterium]|nr:hypothetical protein [Thermoleophilia bacterium]